MVRLGMIDYPDKFISQVNADNFFVRYLPEANRWVPVTGNWFHRYAVPPPHGFNNVPAGDHFFAVIVLDDHNAVANIIPHRYEIDETGVVHEMRVQLLSPEECKEMDRLMIEGKTNAETQRYNDLARRYAEACYPGPKAMAALIFHDLPAPITKDTSCGIHRDIADLKDLNVLQ